MIKLKLIRKNPDNINQNYVHGQLFVLDNTGKHWLDLCYTLEDQVRDINKNGKFDNGEKKVYGKTAIPFGKYQGQVTWSPKFKRMMPLIKDVPEFKGIRIHGGNNIDDTEGCILTAYNTDWKGKIWKSAERDITNLIIQNNKEGKFEIEII